MDSGWLAYTCDSGNVLFFSNKYTNEYRWISCCCPRNNYNSFYNNNNMVLQGAQHLTTDQLLCRTPNVRSIGTDAALPLPPRPTKQLKTQGTQTDVRDHGACVLTNSNVFCLEDSNGNPVNNITIKTVTKDEPRTIYDPPPGTPIIIKVNKRKMYPCCLCDKVLSAYALLVKHMKIYHSIEKSNEECNGMADKIDEADTTRLPPVSYNNARKPQVDQIQCFQCGDVLPSHEAFEDHFNSHYDDLSCKKCDKVFGCKKTSRDHLSTHFGVKHQCAHCSKQYVMKVGLLRHMKYVHTDMWNDKLRAELNRIEQIALNNANNRDQNCINNTTAACTVNNNINDVVKEEKGSADLKPQASYKCEGCGAAFALFTDLTKHKATCVMVQKVDQTSSQENHKSRSSKFKFWCSKCDILLKNKKTYRRHVRCSKMHKSKRSDQASNPEDSSSDKSLYPCPNCHMSFIDAGAMHWHQEFRCHATANIKSQNMVCGYCSMMFKNRVQLSKHWATHITPNNKGIYACDHCNKTLSDQDKLATHLYYHLSVFKCSICNKKCYNFKDLRKHCQKEHKKGVVSQAGMMADKVAKPNYNCNFCGAVFNKTKNQKIHVKRCRRKHRLEALKQTKQCKETESSSQTSSTTTTVQENLETSPPEEENTSSDTPNDVDLLQPKEENIEVACESSNILPASATNQAVNCELDKNSRNLRDRKPVTTTEPQQEEEVSAVNEANFSCAYCKKGFPNKFALVRHEELTKHGQQQKKLLKKRFKCQVCKKVFQSYSVYYHHQLQHNKQNNYTCRTCKANYVSSQALALHKCSKSSTTRNGRLVYHCQFCSASFDSGTGLSNHRRAHLVHEKRGGSQFHCNLCGKVFENAKRLKRHMCSEMPPKKLCINTNKAKKSKQFECADCGKCLSSSRSLLRHKASRVCSSLAAASSETVHKISCPNCSKRFADYSSFQSHHNASHGTGKPCWLCLKDFSIYSNLIRHVKDIHSDATQFFCLYCSKEFKNITEYTKHTAYATPGNRHKCPHCNMDFSLCLHLTDHISSSH